MNRSKLARQIHDDLDIPLNGHGYPIFMIRLIRTIERTIRDGLSRGEEVNIRGFGTFKLETRTPRRTGNNFVHGRDVRSPVPISHPTRKVVVFTPDMSLMALLNHTDTPNYKERRSAKNWNLNDHQ